MKALKTKSATLSMDHICDRCYVRIGTGERHVVKGRKAYHQGCFTKLEIKEGQIRPSLITKNK